MVPFLGIIKVVQIQSHFYRPKPVSYCPIVNDVVHVSTWCVVCCLGEVVLEQFILPVVFWIHAGFSTLAVFFIHTEVLVQALAVVAIDTATLILEYSAPCTAEDCKKKEASSKKLHHLEVKSAM